MNLPYCLLNYLVSTSKIDFPAFFTYPRIYCVPLGQSFLPLGSETKNFCLPSCLSTSNFCSRNHTLGRRGLSASGRTSGNQGRERGAASGEWEAPDLGTGLVGEASWPVVLERWEELEPGPAPNGAQSGQGSEPAADSARKSGVV